LRRRSYARCTIRNKALKSLVPLDCGILLGGHGRTVRFRRACAFTNSAPRSASSTRVRTCRPPQGTRLERRHGKRYGPVYGNDRLEISAVMNHRRCDAVGASLRSPWLSGRLVVANCPRRRHPPRCWSAGSSCRPRPRRSSFRGEDRGTRSGGRRNETVLCISCWRPERLSRKPRIASGRRRALWQAASGAWGERKKGRDP
jgi:hypothetical protein